MSWIELRRGRGRRARLTIVKQGALWLTKAIGHHALVGEWRSVHAAAASRRQLLASCSDPDAALLEMRRAVAEAEVVLGRPRSNAE
jgi:hypothetical protein